MGWSLSWLAYLGFIAWLELTVSESTPPLTLTYSITEEVTPGTMIANIMHDAGIQQKFTVDVLNEIRFRFLSQPPIDFDLEMTTGSLFTSSRFNREEFCPAEESCVVKLDIALQPVQFFQIIKVEIVVEDLNDNVPEFYPRSVSHQLIESVSPGAAITLPTAVDLDSPAFSIVNYELVDISDSFGLEVIKNLDNSIEVKLILQKALDREVQQQYHLQLVAEDGGGLTGTADIAVQVLDANDNNPVFSNLTYEISMLENIALDTSILQVHAVDHDEGENREVRYSFTERTSQKVGSMFSIDEVMGDIRVIGNIDHEEQGVIHLGVIARDMGQGTLPAETMVVVHVLDVNDNPPQITVNTLTTSVNAAVSEEAPVGTFVAHVIVEDKDSGTNANFDCHLVHNKLGLMKIYANEYQVVTKDVLDRESSSYYDITVTCVDHGVPNLESSKSVRVLVNDFNDNPPQFSSTSYHASVLENASPGLVVIHINATDDDIGRNSEIEYSLPYTDSHLFTIDSVSGQVKTTFSFDREQYDQVEFHVIATDKGTPALSDSVLIQLNILDVNDEDPEFIQKGYSFGVLENEYPNIEVGQVAAIDKDSFPNNEFYFSFFPFNSDIDRTETFRIDSQSGVITTMITLDREAKASYDFIISAIDQGTPPRSSTTSVTVYVADKNDNKPSVQFPTPFNNTVKIPVNAHKGYVVTRLMASDNDLGENSRLSYKILNDSYNSLFLIDPNYGVVTLTENVSKSKSRFFSFLIMISDSGTPRQSVRTTLNIYVDTAMLLPEVITKHEDTAESSFLESNNFIIVLALAIASAVVTIILVLAIILIHRHNRIKKEKKYGRYNCRKEALRIFPNMSQASDERTLTFSGNASTLGDASMLKQKKEVSFCLDGSDSTNDCNMSEVVRGAKRPESRQSLPSTIDQQVLQYPQAHSSSLSVQVTSTTSLAACQQQTALATSTVLGVIHEHEEHRQLEVERLMEMLRHSDQNSVGSGEDGSVTDSGRGPSEEGDLPVTSNTELPTFSQDYTRDKKVKTESMQVVPNLSNISSSSNSYTESKSEWKPLQTFVPQVTNSKRQTVDEYRVSSHKDRLTSDSSVSSECTLLEHSTDTGKATMCTQSAETGVGDSVLSNWKKAGHDTEYFYGSYLDYLKKKQFGEHQCSSPSVQGYTPSTDLGGDSTDASLGYSLADMTDCSKPKLVEDRTVTEEDASSVSSATSGSYVVDPQALCNEIDALFFKDTSRA